MNKSFIAVAASLALAAGTSHAADWPSRPIVVLDGFAPGGGTDVFMRVMAVEMTRVPNIVKRAMRCHDFGSEREARHAT